MTTTRRTFLGGALTALGGGLVAGCSERLPRFLVPGAAPADDALPGLARFYRTVCRECPAGCGITARVRDGRVVKLEGSAENPIGAGALCPRGQAGIEGLYAPERLGTPQAKGADLTWEQADKALADGLRGALDRKQLVVVLSRPEPGSLGTLFRTWLAALGQAPEQLVTFDPMARGWIAEGYRRAFGASAAPRHDLAAAKLLVSFGDDFVEEGSPVEHARGLARLHAAGGRFVYIGPRMSLTGAAADEWLAPAPGSELVLALGLARQLLDLGSSGAPAGLAGRLAPYDLQTVAARTELPAETITKLARGLAAARPSLVVGPGRAIAGTTAAAIAEAVAVLNALAGNLGKTVHVAAAPATDAPAPMTLAELTKRAVAGEVGAVIVHHANPHGYGPAFAPLARALEGVPFVAAVTYQLDETAQRAHLVLPDHHPLETWSDVSPRAGVVGLQQPVMTPVLGTRVAADELIAAARTLAKTTGLPDGTYGEAVRAAFDEAAIERGGTFTAAPAGDPPSLAVDALATPVAEAALHGPSDGLLLIVAPSLRQLDGLPSRGTLLHELPDPLTGYSWTGWVELHPTTAASLGVEAGDVVELASAGGRLVVPAAVTERVRAGLIAVPVGYATALLDDPALGLGYGTRVTARPTGDKVQAPHVRGGASQHGRELSRKVRRSLPQLPKSAPPPSLYPPVEHPVHRWGLAIDLDSCNGCGACTTACYVENNLPVVGAEEVARGRAMSWLDVQTFTADGPEVSFLPMMCQHCSAAPCESVCPTEATYHTKEGLNAQVYTRCIGTRYCENNCPYDVRRFNFWDWQRDERAALGLNPDVTVRARGVTEKCTLCVQRIRSGEEQAKVEGRPVRDGEIQTACQATCPAQAITFGDLKDPASAVSKLAADGRAYRLLEELNTQPGVVYLARRRDKA